MMKKRKINMAGEWIEDHLRQLCGAMSPDKRLVIILVMFLLFAALSIYITISSIYRIGMGEGQKIQIQHIERLELELQQKQSQLDSVKQINDFYYEYERETE